MRCRRGFALITVLWLVAILSAAVGLGVAATRLGQRTSFNRIVLARGRWAAEGCLAIVQARWRRHQMRDTATIEMDRDTRCAWQVEDPGARINVNTADGELLAGLGLDSTAIRRLFRGRPFVSAAQFDGVSSDLTVEGPSTVNVSRASARVLHALPGITPEAVEQILARRAIGRPIGGLDELAGTLSPAARSVLLARYADLARLATFSPTRLIVTAEGWIDGAAPRATIEVLTVPLPERLAVIRRRMW
jgi:type II secretory pathway component PulK